MNALLATFGVLAVGGLASVLVMRRRIGRLAETGRIECSFRVLDGHQDGLTTGWRGGVATLGQSDIRFTGTIGGVRFLRRRAVTIPVLGVDLAERRRPSGVELMWVSPNTEVIQVRTTSARLELAILTGQFDWVMQRLGQAAE